MRSKRQKGISQLYVAGYDSHAPYFHRPTVNALLDFLSKNKVDGFIWGGDQLDNDCISHHTKGKPLYRTKRAYLNGVDCFRENLLQPVEERLPKGAERIWIVGNHERFEADLIEEHPELEELVTHKRLLDLEKLGYETIPLGHAKKIGKLMVVHGEILTGIGNQAGMYPAKKAVELYAGNVLAGHTHSPQMFSRVSPVGQQKWQGYIAPVLCSLNPNYLRNRATAWVNGFVIIEFWDSGRFNLYLVNVIDGCFAYGGQIYGG